MRSLILKKAKSLRCTSMGGGDNCDLSISETSNSSLGVVWDRGLGSAAGKKKQDDASKNTKKKSNKNIKQKGESSSRNLGTSLVVDADDRNNNSIIQAGEFRKVQGLTSLEGQTVKVLRQVNNNDKRVKYKKWHVKVQTSGKIKEISGKFLVKFCEIDNNNENTTNAIKPNQQQQQQDSTEKPQKKFNNKTKTPSGGDKKLIPRRGLDCTEKPQKKSNNNNKKKPADSKPETKIMKHPVHPTQPKARNPPQVGLCRQMSTPNRLGSEKTVQVSNKKASSGISPSNELKKNHRFNIQDWDSDSDSDGSMDFTGLFQQKESDSDNDDESIDHRMVLQKSCPDLRLYEKDAGDANDAISSKIKKTFVEPPKRPARRAKSGTRLDQSQGSTESNKKAPLKRNKSLEPSAKQKKKGKEAIDQRMAFQKSCPDLRLCEKDAADANDAIPSKNKKMFVHKKALLKRNKSLESSAKQKKKGKEAIDQRMAFQKSCPDLRLYEKDAADANDAIPSKNKKALLKRNKSLESSAKQKKKGKETNRKKPQLRQSKSSQLQKKKKDARQSSSSSPSSSQMQRLHQSSPAFNFDVNDDTKESTDNNDPPTIHKKSNELFNATDHLIQRVISRNKSLKQRRKSNESSETKIETAKNEVLDKKQLLEATQKEMAALERTIRKSNGVRKMLKRSKSAVLLSPTMKSRSKVTSCTTKDQKDHHQVVEQDVPETVESVSKVPSSLNDSCISLGIEDVGGRRKGLQRSRSAVLPRDIALREEEEKEGGKEEDRHRNVERTISSRNSSSSPPTTATAAPPRILARTSIISSRNSSSSPPITAAPPRILARTSSREAMMRRNRTRSLRDVLRHDEDSCNSSQNDLDHSSNNNSVSGASDEDSTPKRALKKSISLSNLGRKAFLRSRSCSNLGRTRSSKDNVRLDKVQKKSLKGKEERGSRLATLKLKEHKKNQPVLKKIAAMPLQPFRNNNNTTAVKSKDDGPQRRGVTRCLSGGNKLRMH